MGSNGDLSWGYRVKTTKREPDISSFYLVARDGTKLAADLYRPRYRLTHEAFPTILEMIHYPRGLCFKWLHWAYSWNLRKRSVEHQIIKKYVSAGYTYLKVELRGVGASFGNRDERFIISPKDITDAEDVISWISKQTWSNGRIGLIGRSKSGRLMEMILLKNIKSIKALVLDCSTFDNYTDEFFPNGIKNSNRYNNYKSTFYKDIAIYTKSSSFLKKLFSYCFLKFPLPVDGQNGKKLLTEAIKNRKEVSKTWLFLDKINYRNDLEFSLSPHLFVKEIEKSSVPIYSFSGWYHGAMVLSGIKRFINIKTTGSKLIIGRWVQDGESKIFDPVKNEVHISTFDKDSEMIRFFNSYIMEDGNDNIKNEEPIRYQVVNTKEWMNSNTWPPHGCKTYIYHFFEGNILSKNLANKKYVEDSLLNNSIKGCNIFSRWENNFNDKKTIFQNNLKDKLLSYSSIPLEKNLFISGLITINFYIKSNLTDLNLFFYLDEITQLGESFYITDGVFKCSGRKIGWDKKLYKQPFTTHSFLKEDEMLLEPEKQNHIKFDLYPIAYLVKAGSSIKLTIACQDDNFSTEYPEKPEVKICFGEDFQSHISILGKEENKQ